MPQHAKNSKQFGTRIDKDKFVVLSAFVVQLGYCHEREGVKLPAWSEFLEAIADGEIIVYKKITPTPCASDESAIQL